MKKAIISGLLLTVVLIGIYGCAKVAAPANSTLPAGVAIGSAIPSPEATITGGVGSLAGGVVTLNLGGIVLTGTSTPVPIDLSRMAVYTTTGVHTSGLTAMDAAAWTALSTGFYSGSATPIDVMFILDNTGSMGGTIDGVKDSIAEFAATLEANSIDAKFGLITFGDSAIHPTPIPPITQEANFDDGNSDPRPVLDLGTATVLRNKLSAEVFAQGGGDGPENPLDCIKWALNTNTVTGAFTNVTWRPGAQKVFIVLTDINAHQNITADSSSDNKCTTTATLEIARIRNFNAKVYAVSPNYTYSQSPYADVRMLADGFGEGRTTPEAAAYSSGGQWIAMPYGGSVNLTDLGISATMVSGRTVRLEGYTFAAGTVYTIIVYYDADSDGVLDSYAYFVFTYTAATAASPLGISGKWVPADDGIARPNN